MCPFYYVRSCCLGSLYLPFCNLYSNEHTNMRRLTHQPKEVGTGDLASRFGCSPCARLEALRFNWNLARPTPFYLHGNPHQFAARRETRPQALHAISNSHCNEFVRAMGSLCRNASSKCICKVGEYSGPPPLAGGSNTAVDVPEHPSCHAPAHREAHVQAHQGYSHNFHAAGTLNVVGAAYRTHLSHG